MTQNPYTPPTAPLAPPPADDDVDDYVIASQSRRLVNLLIDSIGYYALSFMIGIVLGIFGALDVIDFAGGYPFGFFVIFLYYFPQELLFKRTLGKLVTGTKVISSDGQPLSPVRLAGRTLSRLVPFDGLSFLASQAGWHDRWSNTRVVMVNRAAFGD